MNQTEITTHRASGLSENIAVLKSGAPGPGGAHHHYKLQVRANGPEGKPDGPLYSETHIHFQEGSIAEAGANGVTQEALLAVVKDRLEDFQRGPYACSENADALANVDRALDALKSRTARRTAAGTEGTSAPDAPKTPAKKRVAKKAAAPAKKRR